MALACSARTSQSVTESNLLRPSESRFIFPTSNASTPARPKARPCASARGIPGENHTPGVGLAQIGGGSARRTARARDEVVAQICAASRPDYRDAVIPNPQTVPPPTFSTSTRHTTPSGRLHEKPQIADLAFWLDRQIPGIGCGVRADCPAPR
jgi:hypothetical protein